MYRLQAAKATVATAFKKLAERTGKRDLLIADRDQAQIQSFEAAGRLGQYDLVQILLQKTSDFARQQSKGRIEDMVVQALTVVFPGNVFAFEMVLDTKGQQPIVEYWLTRNGVLTQLKPPDYDNGGGYVDVIILALRLAIAELEGVPGALLMDEVGKHVSAEYSPNVAYFLKQYSEQLGRQILLVTHNESLAAVADHSLRFQLNSKESTEVKAI